MNLTSTKDIKFQILSLLTATKYFTKKKHYFAHNKCTFYADDYGQRLIELLADFKVKFLFRTWT